MTTQTIKISASGRRRTVKFTGDTAAQEALTATRNYLGKAMYQQVVGILRRDGMSFRSFRMQMAMFAGVEGFPVDCMLREYHPRMVRRFGPPSARS